MTLPPLIGERGAAAVSAAMTDTSVGGDAEAFRGDRRKPGHRPRDVDHAGHDGDPPVGLEPADGGRRLPAARPGPDRHAHALAIRQRRPVAPERMRGDPVEALAEAEAAPRRPVGHLVVGRDEVAAAELDRVDVEPAGELVDELLEREGRLRRTRCPVGARADPIGLDPVGDHLVGVPAIWPDGEDGRDPLDAVLGVAAGLEPQARLEAAQPAIPRRPEPDVEDRAGCRVRHPEVLVAGELEAHRPTEHERGCRDERFDQERLAAEPATERGAGHPHGGPRGDRTAGPAPSGCRTSPAWPR